MSSLHPPRRPSGKVKAPKKRAVEPVEDSLQHLTDAIQQIQLHNASSLSFEAHYRYAYNLVVAKHGHTLYNTVAQVIKEHLEKEARDRIVPVFPPSSSFASGSEGTSENVSSAAAGQLFLVQLKQVWSDHMVIMSKLRDVLKYMDKVYTGSSTLPSTWDLGLSLFLHHVVLYSTDPLAPSVAPKAPVSSRNATAAASSPMPLPTSNPATVAYYLISTLLSQIRIERQGEVVSRSTLRSTVEMLCELTDEGAIPLPIAASTGIGAGTPVMGVGSGGTNLRGRPVMGVGMMGEHESPYKTSFEKALLAQSEEFYRLESAALLIECDAPAFLKRIERRLEEEADRAQTYLSPSTEALLVTLLEKTLITAHLDSILNHPASGLSSLVLDSRISDLHRLYRLFGRVATGHLCLQDGLSKWIIGTGRSINDGVLFVNQPDPIGPTAMTTMTTVNDVKGKGKAREAEGETTMDTVSISASSIKAKSIAVDAATSSANDPAGARKKNAALGWVQSVLDLKDKFDTLLSDAFASDGAFEKSINDAFTVFVNQNPRSPEYISLFVDENLKKGLKGKTEVEVDVVLNKTIALFRFLTEKDVFERYYNGHLAKRLVYGRSVSDDAERGMLAKFKVEAGAAFTTSAEGMMKDVKISEDMQSAYKRYQDRPNTLRAGFDMNVIVCGGNFWPLSSKDISCSLPATLLRGTESFRKFYDSVHSGRLLTFHSELGTVDVKVRFAKRTHEINMSTHAMVVLALFEELDERDSLTYNEIASSTSITPIELRRTLQSLACAKFKLLSKSPKGREVDSTDRFTFNLGFLCPLAKFKIQTVANKVDTVDEAKETDARVDESRTNMCEACIVRVMKDRKQLDHIDLINEVVRLLGSRFSPKISMVKQAIERLLEAEYLARDPDNRKALSYMA